MCGTGWRGWRRLFNLHYMYQNLLLEQDENILVVTINRPQALNALNAVTMQELNHLFSEHLPNHADIQGIILTGAGDRAFVAGADIKSFLALDAAQATALSRYGQDVFFKIERCSKPVVAAVNGFALGGGCELAMACHLRIAGEKAKFGQPEVNLGIIAGYGGTQRLIQYVGKTKAMELHLTADVIDANEAYRLGLVNYVVPQGEEVAKAKELLQKITQKAPIAVAQVIESINAYFQEGVNGFDFEANAFGVTAGSEDFKEGATAFIEKRKANFKGK